MLLQVRSLYNLTNLCNTCFESLRISIFRILLVTIGYFMTSLVRTAQGLWTPKQTYQVLCESLQEVRSLYRERTITHLKKKSGLKAKIQLLLFLYPLIASLLSNSVVLLVWAFIGLAINIKGCSLLFQLCYIIFGCFTPIIISFLLLVFTPKSTPDFYQIWWDVWKRFSQKMSKNDFNEYEARRRIEVAVKNYKRNSNFLEIWLMLPLLGCLVDRIITNQDFRKAI